MCFQSRDFLGNLRGHVEVLSCRLYDFLEHLCGLVEVLLCRQYEKACVGDWYRYLFSKSSQKFIYFIGILNMFLLYKSIFLGLFMFSQAGETLDNVEGMKS